MNYVKFFIMKLLFTYCVQKRNLLPILWYQNLIEAKYCSNCGKILADHVINASIPTLNNLEKNSASTSPITTAIQSKSPSIMTVYASKTLWFFNWD